MSIITNEWTYNDLPIIIADPERYPAAARKANSWMQPVGPECGRGWVLMTKADVLACKHSSLSNDTYPIFYPKTLKVASTVPDGSGKPVQKTLTIQNVIILSAKVVSKGQDDEHTIMLVELVDEFYFSRALCVPDYDINLRRVGAEDDSTSDESYYATIDGGTRDYQTWDEACSTMWTWCRGALTSSPTWPGLPWTPALVGPQNIQCRGRSAYYTLYAMLRSLGCTLVRDLSQSWDFTCVRLGYTQSGLAAIESDWEHLRTWEDETITNGQSLVLGGVYKVFYPAQYFASLNFQKVSPPGEEDPEMSQFGFHPGTIGDAIAVGLISKDRSDSSYAYYGNTGNLPLWDCYPIDDLVGESGAWNSNEAGGTGCTLDDRTNEVVKTHWDMNHWPLPDRTIYAGILPDFECGSEVRAIIWRNYGPDRGNDGGPKTEVIKYPGWPKPIYSPSGWAERIELGDDIASEWPGPQAGNSPGAWRAGPDPAAYVYNVTGGTDTTINGVDYWAVNDADLVGETRQGVCTVSFFSPAGSNPAYIRKAAAYGVGVLTGSYEAHPSTGRAVPHYTVWPAFTAVPVDIVTDVTGAGITVTKTTLWVGDDGVL